MSIDFLSLAILKSQMSLINVCTPDVEIFDCRLGRKRLRPNICFPLPRFTHAPYVWKDLEIMEANRNKRKLSGFHCFVFKFRFFVDIDTCININLNHRPTFARGAWRVFFGHRESTTSLVKLLQPGCSHKIFRNQSLCDKLVVEEGCFTPVFCGFN